jgi:Ca-activated chloride channel family protein
MILHRNPFTARLRYSFAVRLIASAIIYALLISAVTAQDKKKRPEQSQQQDEPVQLRADLVVANVTVSDAAGHYAHGLTMKDFSIVEDGVAQTVDSFSAEEAPFAAAILVDMSGSMGHKFGLVRGAAASFVEQIRENDQVAVYGFNNDVRLFQEFSDTRLITDYIWDAEARDTTRMYDCVDEAVEALSKRPEKRRAILLISDGQDSSSRKSSFNTALKKASAAGVMIYTVDLIDESLSRGNSTEAAVARRGRQELKDFADQTGGRYIHSPEGDKLEESFIDVVDELRNQYTLTYYSTNDKRDGKWRKMTINVARQGATARSRKGYFAPKS